MTKSDRAEELEAMIRYAMADHAAIRPRGFDTIRQRNEIHSLIDELLDELSYINSGAMNA